MNEKAALEKQAAHVILDAGTKIASWIRLKESWLFGVKSDLS